ncbi:alpha/beta fold hydrolase [Primorskyibacter flagellatus]|uniref:alpha/beta fold hydrolase n=1 Tax=Primorskyibacter flagellatus TaxID=1387277 RepID=UPI003A8E0C7A
MQPAALYVTVTILVAFGSSTSADTTLKTVSDGDGPVMLFVHGSISDHRAWDPIRAAIPMDRRAVAYDMRYFGKADWPDDGESFSVDTHVADLIEVIEALDAGPVDLVTWSYSGEIGVKAALQRPELFRTMMHYEPVIGSLLSGAEAEAATKDLMSRFAPAVALLKEGDSETAALRFVEVVFKWDDGAAEAEPAEWQEMWRQNGRTLPIQFAAPPGHQVTCEELAALRTPTLVIEGSETHARYSLMAEALVACLPNATLQTFEGYGHDGPYSAPDEVAERLVTFAER